MAGHKDIGNGHIQSSFIPENTCKECDTTIIQDRYSNRIVEKFMSDNNRLFVAGNIDLGKDLKLISALANKRTDIKFLIAPYTISEERINIIRSSIEGYSLIYSECGETTDLSDAQVLIIDYYGDMPYLYRYGSWAYVGGGFTGSLHNIADASECGLPVSSGPAYKNDPASKHLIGQGKINCVKSISGFIRWFEKNCDAPAYVQKEEKCGTITGKTIKAMTMVRNDRFLRKWVEYYGRELGYDNLYVFFDGIDQKIPDFCKGIHVERIDKMQGNVVTTDRKRARFLSRRAAELMKEGADMVIATDADEFLVTDPNLGMQLKTYLSSLPARTCHSGLGIDVMQHIPAEDSVDFSRPFLSQRHRGWLNSRYTKPSVITKPATWGGGFHRVKRKNYRIADGLFLFHFGGVDQVMLREISSDAIRRQTGWRHHQKKRQRAIQKMSRIKARQWPATIRLARWIQTVFRPIFAINKPTMLGIRLVVRIPERFKDIV